MAKPDCDDGWLKLAHELYAALAVARFRERCAIVIREVFEQIYGPAKRPTATIRPADVASRSGESRSHVWDALRELVASNVLAPIEGRPDEFRFNKDYESWLRNGQPRFSHRKLCYIQSTPMRASSWARYGQPESPQTGTVRVPKRGRSEESQASCEGVGSPQLGTVESEARPQTGTVRVPKRGRSPLGPASLSPKNPSLTTPVSPEIEVEEFSDLEKRKHTAGVSGRAGAGAREADLLPFEADNTRFAQSEPAKPAVSEADLRELGDLVEQVFPMSGFDLRATQLARTGLYPVGWIKQAVLETAATGRKVGWVYVYRILQSWAQEGGPPQSPGKASPNASAAPVSLAPSLAREQAVKASFLKGPTDAV